MSVAKLNLARVGQSSMTNFNEISPRSSQFEIRKNVVNDNGSS